MSAKYVHTCIRARDIDRSVDGDVLELTVNVGRDEPYDLGDGYNHLALVVDDLDGLLETLAANGIDPEKPPYAPGGREEYRICFVADPDGYRIELIDGAFPTPQDPPHPSTTS
jgi:lactoylglutathione lyase